MDCHPLQALVEELILVSKLKEFIIATVRTNVDKASLEDKYDEPTLAQAIHIRKVIPDIL